MRRIKGESTGFTLIEMLVSIAIILLLTLAISLSFRGNTTAVSVRNTASELSDLMRTAQNYAQSGVLVDGNIPTAFGIKISTSLDGAPVAILYADVTQGEEAANYLYDATPLPGEAYPDSTQGTVILDSLSFGAKRSGVEIESISVDGSACTGSTCTVDLSFATPKADMRINGAMGNSQVIVSFKKDTVIKTVNIDRVTGRIQSDF